MNITMKKTRGATAQFVCLAIAFVGLAITPVINADDSTGNAPFELRTHKKEVYGTRALEAGDYDRAIQRLEKALARSGSYSNRTPVLINLCIAYTITGDFISAEQSCDASVENGWNLGLAYNNRGVMKVAMGDYVAAVENFEQAGLQRDARRLSLSNKNKAEDRLVGLRWERMAGRTPVSLQPAQLALVSAR